MKHKIEIEFGEDMIFCSYDADAKMDDLIEAMASSFVTICHDSKVPVDQATGKFIDEVEAYDYEDAEAEQSKSLFDIGDDDKC